MCASAPASTSAFAFPIAFALPIALAIAPTIALAVTLDNEEDAEAGGRRLSNSANIGSSLNPNLNPRFNPNLSSFGGEARRRLLENSCGRTWHASEFDMILLFRDASGDILSKHSLKAMKSAQAGCGVVVYWCGGGVWRCVVVCGCVRCVVVVWRVVVV